MIGMVNSVLEPVLGLDVQDVSGQTHNLEVVIDTGFNGFLTLPPARIAALGLTWLYRHQGQLADGSFQVFDVYASTIVWEGQLRTVEAEAADVQPLIGMALMKGHELRAHIIPGAVVTITRVP
jgi:clan AA aspartic protease